MMHKLWFAVRYDNLDRRYSYIGGPFQHQESAFNSAQLYLKNGGPVTALVVSSDVGERSAEKDHPTGYYSDKGPWIPLPPYDDFQQ